MQTVKAPNYSKYQKNQTYLLIVIIHLNVKYLYGNVDLLLKIALSQDFDKLTDSISPILMASSTSAGMISPPIAKINIDLGKN